MPKPKMSSKQRLNFGASIPPPPPHLDDDAKKEYRRVGRAMEQAGEGYLQCVDVALLATYAQAWSDVIRLTPLVRGKETLTSDKGNDYPNPLAASLSQAQNRVQSVAKELGLSPNSRKRIGEVMPKTEEDNPVSKFMEGRK
jgi:P27 family predicted phage terminase small subunit